MLQINVSTLEIADGKVPDIRIAGSDDTIASCTRHNRIWPMFTKTNLYARPTVAKTGTFGGELFVPLDDSAPDCSFICIPAIHYSGSSLVGIATIQFIVFT